MILLQNTLIFGSFFTLMVAVLISILESDHPASTIEARKKRYVLALSLAIISVLMSVSAIILKNV